MRLSQSGFESDFQCTTHWVHILKLQHWGRVQSVEKNVSFSSMSNDMDRRKKCYHLKGEVPYHLSHEDLLTHIISRESVVTLHFTNLSNSPRFPSNTSVWIRFEQDVKVQVCSWSIRVWEHRFQRHRRFVHPVTFKSVFPPLTCPCTDHCGNYLISVLMSAQEGCTIITLSSLY